MAGIPAEGHYEVHWTVGGHGTKGNTAPVAPPEELTYLNAGKQDLTGYTNTCGIVKGNGNGSITFGSGDQEKQAAALVRLFGPINSKDDGKTQNGSPNNHPTSTSGRKFVNDGEQKLKGLTNVIGCTEGDRNAAITFPNERM